MRRVLASALAIGLGLGLAGCGETSKVEESKTIEGPGGKTTETNISTVKQSGENPPAPTTAEPPAK